MATGSFTFDQPKLPVNDRRWWRRVRRDRMALVVIGVLGLIVLVSLAAPLSPYDPTGADFASVLDPPSAAHPLGTDALGRDLLTRIAHGGRISLAAGLLAVGLATSIGVLLGAVGGYLRGPTDLAVTAITDLLLAFPPLLLAILLVAVLGPSLTNAMVAVGLAMSPGFIRLVRATVLTESSKDYVEAAHAVGVHPVVVVFRHILPNSLAPMIVQISLTLGAAILATAGLGFLGLGAQPPTAEWGRMVSEGRSHMATSPHLIVFPGAAVAITVLAMNLLGDSLRDALDPRLA